MVITDIIKNPPVFSSRDFCGRHNSNEQQYDLDRGAFLAISSYHIKKGFATIFSPIFI